MDDQPSSPTAANQNPHDARRRFALIATLLVVAGAGIVGSVWAWDAFFSYPKRFAAVVPGQLYRSGEVSAAELARLQDEVGIETVLCLLNPAEPVTQKEKAAAEALGLKWINIGLPGNGASEPADRVAIMNALRDASNAPMLVHCAAGTNRTGLAIGLHRIHEDGWTYEQVLDEMKQFGFEDLPKHENLRNALRIAAEAEQIARAGANQAAQQVADTEATADTADAAGS